MDCSKSELDFFTIPATQTSIEDNTYTRVNPLTAVTSSPAPIEFIINASSEHYIDPANIYLYVKLSIKNRDLQPLKAEHKYYFESNILHSIFSDVEIYLNETKITSGGGNYPYRAFLENSLNYTRDEKLSKLECEGFYPITERAGIIKHYDNLIHKTVEGYGKLHSDIFFQPRLILSGCDIKIKLYRNTTAFCIKSAADTPAIKDEVDPSKLFVCFEEVYLDVRRVKLTSHQHLQIEKNLSHSAAKYPITRVDVKTFAVNSGISSIMLNHIVTGKLPSRIMYGLISHP